MPIWAQAGFWGLVSGSALVLGAALAYVGQAPQRLIALVMAFGSGVLISALSFDLMQEAFEGGGFAPAALGFVAGAVVYTAANVGLNKVGAKHRKRSTEGLQETEASSGGSGAAIALGALMDGIPESVAIGLSLVAGSGVSAVAVGAVFLSNLPEGLSSAAGMRKAKRPPLYVFGVWIGIALMSGLAATLGVVFLGDSGPVTVAVANAVAAGAILAMLVDTMVPEAFEGSHEYAGLGTVAGVLAALALSKLGG